MTGAEPVFFCAHEWMGQRTKKEAAQNEAFTSLKSLCARGCYTLFYSNFKPRSRDNGERRGVMRLC